MSVARRGAGRCDLCPAQEVKVLYLEGPLGRCGDRRLRTGAVEPPAGGNRWRPMWGARAPEWCPRGMGR